MLQSLLSSIHSIHKNDRTKVGEHFNVFNVLQLESEEVRLHSRFLAHLLNPNGNHGYGKQFLEKFLEYTGETKLFPNIDRVTILVEKPVGIVTPTSGGQIDILVQDNQNNVLIIENKIYASDQENQMLRYRNYGNQQKAKGGSSRLIYLTLFGNLASSYSLGNDMSHDEYQCLSYKTDIRAWLEDCLLIIKENTKVSSILEHYHQLILQLTGMETNEQLALTVNQLIDSSDNFKAAERISNAIYPAKYKLLHSFIQEVIVDLKKEFPSLIFELSDKFGHRYHGLEIHHKLRTPHEVYSHIRFSFLSDASNCYIEIHPGIINGVDNDKIEVKRQTYISELNHFFPANEAKIRNTEKNWQGEWVAFYFPMENSFKQIIENDLLHKSKVLCDLRFIIIQFLKTEGLD